MKNVLKISISIICIGMASATYANWFADIVDRIEKTNAINTNILQGQMAELNIQQDILASQKGIEKLMQQVDGNLRGHSGWGTYQFHDYQSYGDGARDWAGVMHMAENGRGKGELGETLQNISTQFPANQAVFNQGITGTSNQKYYAVKTRTILAARAASELDYNKVQDQIAYQQMLQQQIEKTADLKAAVDLSNRIQVEGNLIGLEVLRQTALANQQQAINEQAGVNSALSNAKFLTK